MGWSDFVGRDFTRAEFAAYVEGLKWTNWKPLGIVIHNTAAPTLAQWAESGTAHSNRIKNLRNYYENEQKWHGGPHLFVSRDWITVFDGLLEPGTHSPSFNKTHFGIEMVGDYSKEEFNSGDGAKVRDNAVFATAVLCRKHKFNPDIAIKLHKEDPKTTHDCPGKKVNKVAFIGLVKKEIARQGGIPLPEAPPPRPEPPVVATSTDALRRRMAKLTVSWEAQRDKDGHLLMYEGSKGPEIAGITQYDHPGAYAEAARLLREGKWAQAEILAENYVLNYTQQVTEWGINDAGLEFFLRDTCFHRGPTGAIKILQIACGVEDDGIVGPKTRAAITKRSKDVPAFIDLLRGACETYEIVTYGKRTQYWTGLTNRWNNRTREAKKFHSETNTIPEIVTSAIVVAGGAAAGVAVAQGFDWTLAIPMALAAIGAAILIYLILKRRRA